MRIRVAAGLLFAGDARIPWTALGEPESLDGEEARAWRAYKEVLPAFMVMRSHPLHPPLHPHAGSACGSDPQRCLTGEEGRPWVERQLLLALPVLVRDAGLARAAGRRAVELARVRHEGRYAGL
ncbi:DUF3093 family protein [Streptomyces collinus]|uniref:DUF3093 family protein n=1 Tax=Streptomyces collinus TaxID=42684 RepID=UPI0036B097F7